MPTESAIPGSSGSFSTISSAGIKCSLCGAGAAVSSSRDVYGVVLLSDPPERICGTCAIVQNGGGSGVEDDLGHRLRDMTVEEGDEDDEDGRGRDEHREDMDDGGMFTMDMGSPTSTRPMPISTGVPIPSSPSIPTCIHSQSLPNQSIRPWKTSTPIPPILEKPETPKLPSVPARIEEEEDGLPNPLLDVTKKRNPSIGRGALFAGSIFKGTQTSGRSAYDVEVRFVVSPKSSIPDEPCKIVPFVMSLVTRLILPVIGRQLYRVDCLWIPLHLEPHRRPSSLDDILYRGDRRSSIWLHHWLSLRSDRARRYATLGPIRAVPPTFHEGRYRQRRDAVP